VDQLELEKCLDDNDSDFNDFDSVASDRVKFYEDSYRQMMKQVNVPKKEKVYFKIHKKHLHK
jgi:pyoverdine/dityrosine biosynthesis protein Dit1